MCCMRPSQPIALTVDIITAPINTSLTCSQRREKGRCKKLSNVDTFYNADIDLIILLASAFYAHSTQSRAWNLIMPRSLVTEPSTVSCGLRLRGSSIMRVRDELWFGCHRVGGWEVWHGSHGLSSALSYGITERASANLIEKKTPDRERQVYRYNQHIQLCCHLAYHPIPHECVKQRLQSNLLPIWQSTFTNRINGFQDPQKPTYIYLTFSSSP